MNLHKELVLPRTITERRMLPTDREDRQRMERTSSGGV